MQAAGCNSRPLDTLKLILLLVARDLQLKAARCCRATRALFVNIIAGSCRRATRTVSMLPDMYDGPSRCVMHLYPPPCRTLLTCCRCSQMAALEHSGARCRSRWSCYTLNRLPFRQLQSFCPRFCQLSRSGCRAVWVVVLAPCKRASKWFYSPVAFRVSCWENRAKRCVDDGYIV